MFKKSFNFVAIILVAITIIGLSSCKDEVHYSCNPTIDAVIKQNLPYYQGMTRREWKTLPDSLKRAAFVAMTPELKITFWKGKLDEMMNARFFTDAEKRHISKLYNYLLSVRDVYTDKYANNSKEIQKNFEFYKEWAFYGIDNFKWDVIDVFLIAENGEELTEDYIEHVKHNAQQRKPETELQQAGGTNGNKPDCECTWDGGCMGQGNCNDKECRIISWGCKFLFMGECTKKCKSSFTMKDKVINVVEYSNQKELLEYMLR